MYADLSLYNVAKPPICGDLSWLRRLCNIKSYIVMKKFNCEKICSAINIFLICTQLF